MKNKNEIIKAAGKMFHLKGAVKNPKIMNPNRDWWTGLLIGFTIFIVTASWSATTYISNRSPGLNVGDSVVSEVVVYRASHVEAALEAYKKREQEHRSLIDGNYSVVEEPSVEIENSTSTATTTDESTVEEIPTPNFLEEEVDLEGSGESDGGEEVDEI